MNISSHPLTLNIFGGFLAAVVFGATVFVVRLGSNWFRYRKYRGHYHLYEKYKNEEGIQFKVEVVLKGWKKNQFYLCGEDTKKPPEKIKGNVYFGDGLPRQGIGQYQHKPGWGFMQMQIAPETKIYSIHSFANEGHHMSSVSYIWYKEHCS